MPEIYLIILGVLVGVMFTAWSLTMLFLRFRTAPEERGKQRSLTLILIILLIGAADLLKALRDLYHYFN